MPSGIHSIRARQPSGSPTTTTVYTDEEHVARVLEDAAHFPGGHASGVAFPKSEAELAALVRTHARVLAMGAQSSLTGGATPMGEVVLSLTRMSRILDATGDAVRVEPGVPLTVLQEALSERGRY